MTLPRLAAFVGTSLDGYLATLDDDLGWLEAAGALSDDSIGEPLDYGFGEFLDSVDALAMGRRTFDHVWAHCPDGRLPFGDRPVEVFTHRPLPPGASATPVDLDPAGAVRRWAAAGHGRVYVDGGTVITAFLAAGLLDELVVTIAPVLLGAGRPLFGPGRQRELRLTATRSWPTGMVQVRYELARE